MSTNESTANSAEEPTGLALLRMPFPPHQISKLPKPYKKDSPKGKCAECGGYHGLPAMHLDYVGHAALTDRLLDADPAWSWEPVAMSEKGEPMLDSNGGMWIRLTVCGVTRLGYGDAQDKTGANAVKERIGDALRNAAMRFGAALELWHKGDLHEAAEARGDAEEPKRIPRTSKEMAEHVASLNVSPTAGLREQLAPDRLKAVEKVASNVIDCFNEGLDGCQETALEVIDEAGLDTDEKAALWTFFDSKMRSALKKARQAKDLRETVPVQA